MSNPEKMQYTCKFHSEIVEDEPGSCAICGKKLIPKIIYELSETEENLFQIKEFILLE